MTTISELQFSLLTEPLIRYRRASDGGTVHASLPQLFVALASDAVRDYPALRPHQRHPWHAFLVQLAAIVLHKAGRTTAFETSDEWFGALLALTPDDPDGAAWCLVSPPGRPALFQAAVVGGSTSEWKSVAFAADEIDMLVTSKNHDIKGSRARHSQPEDWLFALLSLQTQDGYPGSGNFGISRMNGGWGSKLGVGVAAVGLHGGRWVRDFSALLAHRERTVEEHGLQDEGGLALVWLAPWDGLGSLSFSRLDPFYIEICRCIRLQSASDQIQSIGTTSKAERIAAKSLKGMTGDAWTPIDVVAGSAISIPIDGFNYQLVSELIFGGKYKLPIAYNLVKPVNGNSLVFIAQGIKRGKSKTEGYHERRLPMSPKLQWLLQTQQREPLARLSGQRIAVIVEMRKLLWSALVVLFSNGKSGDSSVGAKTKASVGAKTKASRFSDPFESAEDSRFFDDLNEELEAINPTAMRLQWMLDLVGRAESILNIAFDSGPRSSVQKYRSQSAALVRFYGGLRSEKLPDLANHYRNQTMKRQEELLEHT